MPRRHSSVRQPKRLVRAAVAPPQSAEASYEAMARDLVERGLRPRTILDRRRLVVFEKKAS